MVLIPIRLLYEIINAKIVRRDINILWWQSLHLNAYPHIMQASRSTDKGSTKTRNREIAYFNLPLDDSTIIILSAYLIRCLLLIHVYFKLIMHAYTQQRL